MAQFRQDADPFSLAVIVPNRNDAKYLSRCIESVITQAVHPDEFIIIDDESTDNSVEVIESAIKGCSFARLHKNAKNMGGVQTANAGLRMARSKFVFFLGANDFVMPDLFARAKECLRRHPQTGVWSAMVWLVDEQDRLIRMHPSAVISLRDSYFPPEKCRILMCRLGNWLTGQTTIYRREALLEVGGFDPSLKALCDLLAAHVVVSRHGAAYSPAPLGVMRVHEGAFLPATLSDSKVLDSILDDIRARGPKLEPGLFTPAMLIRTELRFYFASLRLSEGATIAHIMNRSRAMRRVALAGVRRFIPASFKRLRVAAFFAIMRPFDILPTIWYRIFGAGLVLLVQKFHGRKPV
jgi:glycosyltransferase involved in cell wall biosynthesis